VFHLASVAVVRTVRYHEIAEALRGRVQSGEFPAGRLLPSESELSAEFGVSRVTVRRALEVLRDESLLDARQGFGWFVASDPVRQRMGRLRTIEAQMAESGLRAERRIIEFGFVPADKATSAVLGSGEHLRVRRVNLADGTPFAVVTVWCPSRLAHHLSRADVERAPFYELLGISLGGATQTIGAAAASPEDASELQIPVGSPVLRCERVTRDVEGNEVLFSVHVFPAHRTEFVVDLVEADESIAPTGLRLVNDATG
jgi:GntR family transcriptional regulator